MIQKSKENLTQGSKITETEFIIQRITETYPQLKEDVTYFKIFLKPLELWMLKWIVYQLRPFTVRDFYCSSILSMITDILNLGEDMPFYNDLRRAYPQVVILSERKQKEIMKRTHKKMENLSPNINNVKRVQVDVKTLKKLKMRFPSQNQIKRILEKFEVNGIVKSEKKGFKKKKEKQVWYILNPYFYKEFKDKFPEILKL